MTRDAPVLSVPLSVARVLPVFFPSVPVRAVVIRPWTAIYAADTSARTRSGLPLPLTIFSGAAITMAPVGGS